MQKTREIVFLAVAVVMGALWLGALGEAADLRELKIEAELERDSLAADAAAERARAEGWSVTFGVDDPELLEATLDSIEAEGDSLGLEVGRLRTDLEASRVRLSLVAVVVATLQGELESIGQTEELAPDSSVVSFAGEIDEAPLSASWVCRVPTRALELAYGVRITGELIQGESGDGRPIVFARATTPHTILELEDLIVDLPEPVVERRGPSWYWIPIAFLSGLGASELANLLSLGGGDR